MAKATSTAWQEDDRPQSAQPDEKVLRYHQALQRRPVPGYLFDRFYNSWLDASSIKELEAFLTDKAAQTQQTADRLLLAFFFSKQEQDARALEQFRLALENDPANAEVLYEKAVIESRVLNFENALADLDAALKLDPKAETEIKISKLQGKLHARNLDTEKALAAWNRIVEAHPGDDALKEDLIDLQLQEGLQTEALELLDKLIAETKDPYKKVIRSLQKADILQQQEKQPEALEVYNATLDKVELNSWIEREVLAQIAQSFRRQDDVTGLVEYYKQMLENHANRISLRKALAKVLVEMGSNEEAIEQAKSIVALTPGDRANREFLVELLSSSGAWDEAVQQTEALVKQFPKDAELLIRLANIYFQQEKTDEAAEALQNYVEVAGKSEFAYLRSARLLEKFQRIDQAEQTLKIAVESFPDSSSAQEALAGLLFQNERQDEAIEIWNRLAQGADKSQVLRIARVFSSRQLHQNAFDLLESRLNDFASDSIYLGQLCSAAEVLKKYQQALPWVRQRIELADDSIALDLCLGQAMRLFEKAEQTREEIQRIGQDDAAGLSMKCFRFEMLARDGQAALAETQLKQAIDEIVANEQLDPGKRTNALQMLGQQRIRILSNQFDWRSAAQAAQELVELPGGQTVFNLKRLVELLLRSNQPEEALKWIAQWRKAVPNSPEPWLREARILASLNQGEQAISVLRSATRKFPDDTDLMLELAEQYSANGQAQDAERIYWLRYEESESLSDKLRWAERLARHCYENDTEYELVESFVERRRNNPMSIEPILALAQIYQVMDDYQGRREALAEALRLQPENLQLIHELAQTEETEGEWESAVSTLRTAVPLDPTSRTRQKIASIYFKYDEIQQGLKLLADLAGGEDADPRDIEKIVDAIVQSEEWEIAYDWLKPLADRYPNDYRLQYQKGVIEEELEMRDSAVQTFLTLLNLDQEITGLNNMNPMSGPMGMGMGGMADAMRQLLPPEPLEIVELLQAIEPAYAHQEVRGSNFGGYYSYTYSSREHINLPEDLAEMKRFAVAHLVRLVEDSDEARQAEVLEEMEFRGVPHPKLVLRLGAYGSLEAISYEGSALEEVIEQESNRRTMLALTTFQAGTFSIPDRREMYREGFEEFKEDYPGLALINGIQHLVSGGADEALEAELVKLTQRIDQPGETLFGVLFATLRMEGLSVPPFNGGATYTLQDSTRSELGKTMESWVTQMSSNQDSLYYLGEICGYYLSQKRVEDFLALVEKGIERFRNEAQSGSSQRYSRPSYYLFDPDRDGVSFPPDLNDLPSWIVELFDPANELGGNPFGPDSEPTRFAELFSGKTGDVQDPSLRLLLEARIAIEKSWELTEPAEAFEEVLKECERLVEQQPRNLDLIMLSASIAGQARDFGLVHAYLSKAEGVPMSRTQRQTFDASILKNALSFQEQGSAESEAAQAVLDYAKISGKRLLRSNLPSQIRPEVVGMLTSLGLEKEIESIASQPNAGAMPSLGMFHGGGHSAGSVTNPETAKLREWVADDKVDVAVRNLAQQIRPMTRLMTDIDSIEWLDSEEMLGTQRLVHLLGLKQPLLEYFARSNTKSARISYAALHQFLGDEETASKLYEELLQQYPNEDGIRYQLLSLLAQDKPAEFLKQFAEIDPQKADAFVGILTQVLDNQNGRLADRIEFAARISEQLQAVDEENRLPLKPFAEHLQTKLTEYLVVYNGPGMEELYAPFRGDDNRLTEERLQLLERRLSIHDQLCEWMIQSYGSEAAFSSLLRSKQVHEEKLDEEQFLQWAIEVIQHQEAGQPPRGRSASGPRYRGKQLRRSASTTGSEDAHSPAGYFESKLVSSENESDRQRAQSIIEELRAAGRDELADYFNRIIDLYEIEEAGYQQAAEKFIETSGKSSDIEAKTAAFNKAISIWAARKLEADISDFVTSFQKELWSLSWRNTNSVDCEAGAGYLSELIRRGQQEQAEAILEKWIEGIFRDPAKIASLLQSQMRNYQRGSPSRQLVIYLSLINSLMVQPETCWLAMNQLQKYPSVAGLAMSDVYTSDVLGELDTDEAIEEFLARSPFEATLAEFDPLFIEEMGIPMLNVFMLGYLDPSEDSLKPLVEHAKRMKPETFGRKVWQVLLTESNRIGRLLELLGENLEELEMLPPNRQSALAMFVFLDGDESYLSRFEPDRLTENGQKAYDLLRKEFSKALRNRMADFGEASDDNPFGNVDGLLLNGGYLELVEPDQARQICIDLAKGMEEASRKSRRRDRYAGNNVGRQLKEIFIGEGSYFRINLVLDLLRSPDFPPFLIDPESFGSTWGNALSRNSELEELERFQKFYEEFGAKLAGRDPIVLFGAMTNLLDEKFPGLTVNESAGDRSIRIEQQNREFLDRLIAWSLEESQGGKYPQLAKTILYAARMSQATVDVSETLLTDDQQPQRLAEPSEWQRELLELMASEDLTDGERLNLSALVSDPTLPEKAVLDVIDRVLEVSGDDLVTELRSKLMQLLRGLETNSPRWQEVAEKVWDKTGSREWLEMTSSYELVDTVPVLARLNEQGVINQLIRESPYEMNEVSMIASLLEADMTQQARLLAQSKLTTPYESYVEDIRYTRRLDEILPAFLENITDAQERMAIEVLFADLQDTRSDSRKADTTREERLTSIAKRYGQIKHQAQNLNIQILSKLLTVKECFPIIEEASEQLLEELNPLDYWGERYNDSPQLRINRDFLIAYSVAALQNQRENPFRYLVAMIEDEHPEYWKSVLLTDYAVQSFLSNFGLALRMSAADVESGDRKRIAREVLQLIETQPVIAASESVIALLFVIGIVENDDALLDSVKVAFNESKAVRESMEYGYMLDYEIDEIWEMVARENPDLKNAPFEKRFQVTQSVWQMAKDLEISIGTDHFRDGVRDICDSCRVNPMGLELIVQSGLLTEAELGEQGKVLAQINSVDGEIWRQLGYIQTRLGLQDAAVESFRQALEATGEELDRARENRAVEYAHALFEAGRKDQIPDLLKTVEKRQLLGDNIGRFDKLNRIFQQAGSPKAEDQPADPPVGANESGDEKSGDEKSVDGDRDEPKSNPLVARAVPHGCVLGGYDTIKTGIYPGV